jgi:hypothetical protein
MQDQAAPSFDEWVEYCFTKGESEFHSKAQRDRSYYAVSSLTVIRPDLFPRSQIPLDEVARFLVRLFRAPGFIADRFTDDQICDGAWFIFGYGGQYFPYVRRDPVPREIQFAVISSIATLYTELFDHLCCERGTDPDKNYIEEARLDNTVWMLWDMIGFSVPSLDVGLFPSVPDLVDTGFDVLETVLTNDLKHELLLYDITSTYFEGECLGNPQAQRGYSRDSRPDCKQVCIGLVVTTDGIPLGYEVFAGNTNDSTTVESIVRTMERKYGKAERIWVMDRGMVSADNLRFLRSRGGWYIVGTPEWAFRISKDELAIRPL